MTADTLAQFRNELDSFFVLVLLNIVFGALAIAFGVQFMVSSVQGITGEQSLPLIRIIGRITLHGKFRAGHCMDYFQC